MSHRNVNKIAEDVGKPGYESENRASEINLNDINKEDNKDPEEIQFSGLEVRVERLKNDLKNLKKIKKQQEKLGKLEEKKIEILNEIEREQVRERRSNHKHDRRKR